MSDKLLTLKEAADSLSMPEEEVRRLVEVGKLPAYQIAGLYLRFKEEHIISLKEGHSVERHDLADKDNLAAGNRYRLFARAKDFFYFNDFYIISTVIVLFLIYIIYKSLR